MSDPYDGLPVSLSELTTTVYALRKIEGTYHEEDPCATILRAAATLAQQRVKELLLEAHGATT